MIPPAVPAPLSDDDSEPLQSFLELLQTLPDPRSAQGRRHPLPALLALLVAGFAAGANTMTAIVAFGRERPALRRRLGFTHPVSPSQSTYCRLFEVLPVETLRQAMVCWLGACARRRAGQSPAAAAADGKAMRKSGVHVMHVFLQDYWQLIDLFEVAANKNELSAFEDHLDGFLARHPWLSLLTFDALFCQRSVVKQLVGKGKKAIFQVKGNQKETLRRLRRHFSPLAQAKPGHQSEEKKKQVGDLPGPVASPGAR